MFLNLIIPTEYVVTNLFKFLSIKISFTTVSVKAHGKTKPMILKLIIKLYIKT